MQIECGFQANHSGYWWDTAIMLRFDESVQLPSNTDFPSERGSETNEPPSPEPASRSELEVPIERGHDLQRVVESEEAAFDGPGLPLRRRIHGNMEDPVSEISVPFLEDLWCVASSPETLTALQHLGASHSLYTAVEHTPALLDLPGVVAVDVLLYTNGLDLSPPRGEAVFRVAWGPGRQLMIQVDSMKGEPSRVRGIIRDLAGALGWDEYNWLSDADAVQAKVTLGPLEDHCPEFREQYYLSYQELVTLSTIYHALAEGTECLGEALDRVGWTLSEAMEKAIRGDCYGAFFTMGRKPSVAIERCERGKAVFWKSAAAEAVPYLKDHLDGYHHGPIVEAMALASREEFIGLAQDLMTRSVLDDCVLHASAHHGFTELVPDILRLIERNAAGCYTYPLEMSGSWPTRQAGWLMVDAILALQKLTSDETFEALCLSAYVPPDVGQTPTLSFSWPILVESRLEPSPSPSEESSASSIGDREAASGSYHYDGSREFREAMHAGLMASIKNREILARILGCENLSEEQRTTLREHLDRLIKRNVR